MSRALAEARAARDEARAAFDARMLRLRGDPEAKTVGEHMLTRIADDARGGMTRAMDVAAESKGIAAATAALLALWFLRAPLLAWIDGLLGSNTDTESEIEDHA